MTQQDFIEQSIELYTLFDLAIKHNDETAMNDLAERIRSLSKQAMDELSEEEYLEAAFIIDNS